MRNLTFQSIKTSSCGKILTMKESKHVLIHEVLSQSIDTTLPRDTQDLIHQNRFVSVANIKHPPPISRRGRRLEQKERAKKHKEQIESLIDR